MNDDRVAISQLLVLQNYTRNNRTQGIMEKSQKNLKTWRHGKIYARLNDFVEVILGISYFYGVFLDLNNFIKLTISIRNTKKLYSGMIQHFSDISGIIPQKVILKLIQFTAFRYLIALYSNICCRLAKQNR